MYIQAGGIYSCVHSNLASQLTTGRAEMSEAEKARGSLFAPPYSSPDPPPPGLPSTQQSVPTQLPPQQALAVQTQPPPPTGPQYYTQLAYPAVSGLGVQ